MGCVLFVALVLSSFAVCGSSGEPLMVSVPLGFEISGSDTGSWVSENGVFAFGFLGDSQKGDGFVVGIWYNLKNSEDMPPVWTVGGGVRVSGNSTFQLAMDGSLVLFDENHGGLPVWSSSTAHLGVQSATLLNNGNLVLIGDGNRVVWESFGSPTDTLLPGQSLKFPQSLQAPSTNSIASYYKLEFTSAGAISLLWGGNVTYWTSDLNLGSIVKEARFEPNGLFGLFDDAGGIAWYRLSEDFKEPSTAYRHLRIDEDGNLRIYSWNNSTSTWKVGWQAVQNQCDVFGSCGLYKTCGYNSTSPVCDCLFRNSESHECEKVVDLGNCDTAVSMVVLKQTVLYSLFPPHDVESMLSSEACMEFCLNDTSCYAATAKNDGSGLCSITRTIFISGYRHSTVPATSYLKVCFIPQAVAAQAANLHKEISMPTRQSRSQIGEYKNLVVAVSLLLLVTALIFLTMEMFIFWYIVHQRKSLKQDTSAFGKDAQKNLHYSALVRLSYEEVTLLMRNFTVKIGPTVYKGILPNRVPVAAKVLNNAVASERDFHNLISTLGSTHHKNLVSLKGFCYEPPHEVVLYEYINNGSLDQWLFNRRRRNRGRDSWKQRISMAIGVARGVAYLHFECKQCIAHGNLKLENVLLDDNFIVKVTDFGLQGFTEKKTSSSSETLLEKDVYMFGSILLQIVSGKRDSVGNKLYEVAYEMCHDRMLERFVDASLEGGVEIEGVERAVRLALWCMQCQPSLRPSISEVVMVLEGSLSLDMPPKLEA